MSSSYELSFEKIIICILFQATHANEVDRVRIGKMIDAYVEKYRTLRQHNTSKISNRNIS
jgi:hypothetical protein